MERGIRYRQSGRSLRSRWSLGLALGVGFAMSFVLPAKATTPATLDQFQLSTSGVEPAGQMAKTFTAGMSGQLDRVSLSTDTSLATFTVQVESVSGTFPAGTTVLGTNSTSGASYTCCRRLNNFYFTPNIQVTKGGHYAIVVMVPSTRSHLSWYTSNGSDNYAGGSLYVGTYGGSWGPDNLHGGDFAFQTWVIGGSAPPPHQAPTLAARSPTASVPAGTPPTLTGPLARPLRDTPSPTPPPRPITPPRPD